MTDLTWDQRIDRFYAEEFDDADAAGSIARMKELLADLPEDDAVALFELGGVHDSLGLEQEAIPLYRRAIEAGLDAERFARVRIQLASSLRNIGEVAEAVEILRSAPGAGDDDPARLAFLALALHDVGRSSEALQTALLALVPFLDRYTRSLTGYAGELTRENDKPA